VFGIFRGRNIISINNDKQLFTLITKKSIFGIKDRGVNEV